MAVYVLGSPFAGAHGPDHGVSARDDVASTPDPLPAASPGLGVGSNLASLLSSQPGGGLGQDGLRPVPQGQDHGVYVYSELGARLAHWLSASPAIGLAKLHLDALHGHDPALLIADEAYRGGQKAEAGALFFGALNLFFAGRHLRLGAAV